MRHGSHLNPPNRFQTTRKEADWEQLEWDTEYLLEQAKNRKIQYLDDKSKSIVTENNSPDIRFRYSVNPYRGCVHACSYCYARPYHEYLGFNAGLDFETKILVKHDAPKLLEQFLARKNWEPEMISFSGITDCFQPAEREFKITRQCLEVASKANQPIGIVTKNALVVRDLDILAPMAAKRLVTVCVSVTTLDSALARTMEPRTSIPKARLRAISELAKAGIPTKVLVAPIIPGLNDNELPAILQAAKEAGAHGAGYVLLRLPLTVEPVFLEWLQRTQPDHKDRVLNRIRQCREGSLSDSKFGSRMRGSGEIAEQIKHMFQLFSRKYGLDQPLPELNCELFTPPRLDACQLRLF
jgi:DNA repair photolyase